MTPIRLAFALALCGAAALPFGAMAQDAAAEPAPAATETPAPAADALALGQEVDANALGSTYDAATFGEWAQKCVRSGTDADPCQLYQLLKDEAGTSVAEFNIFGLPANAKGDAVAGATFIAPLETLLPAGMTLQIDGSKPKVYPFAFCAQLGCVIRLGFTAAEVEAMKKGNKMTATIVPFVAQDQKVNLSISLSGFTAGYEAVNAANVKADAAAAAAAAKAPAAAPAAAPDAAPAP